MIEICEKEDIILFSASDFGKNNGSALQCSGQKIIIYNDALSGWRQILVISHELAHHVLGHLINGNNNTPEKREQNEREAQAFSAAFVAMALFFECREKLIEKGARQGKAK
jgi:Zn-dependent peptidase ImmA (M78 family)